MKKKKKYYLILGGIGVVLLITIGGRFFFGREPSEKKDSGTTPTIVVDESEPQVQIDYSTMTDEELAADAARIREEAERAYEEQVKQLKEEAEQEKGPLTWVTELLCFDEEGNFYYLTEFGLHLEMTKEDVDAYGKENLLTFIETKGGSVQ